ncbi:hypothetical protein KUTeg_007822 [Tegillarca granosa]|uniref:HpcH/HpaI aldolase/citrate lyase domain-containing protein n=1 Tax=Tegillarca granosa TaxID=220873 RepID=A0ABQ9FIC2_TEGGR|nr:hypothetical protein KUTeg_007822 [Tegillarca granosa]
MALTPVILMVSRRTRGVGRIFTSLKPQCESVARFYSASVELPDMFTGKKYIPRRAVLYVPGSDKNKLQKITSLDVDCAVMDCEDGVAMNRKEIARSNIREMLDVLDFGRTECVVRVNSASSGLMGDDLKEILKADKQPMTIMLPKVQRKEEIDLFTQRLKDSLEGRQHKQKFNLITFVESAMGMMNLKEVCNRTFELSLKHKLYVHDGIVFGSDDFCADIGATRTKDATELLYARQKVVVCAKAFGLQAIDLVHIDYKDLEGLEKQSLEGARMGFTETV